MPYRPTRSPFAWPIRPLPLLLAVVLGGCGGGGGGGAAVTNTGPAPVRLTVSDASIAEGDAGTSSVSFAINLSAAASDTVTVDYSTEALTATAGTDYQSAAGQLSIPAGTTTASVSVAVIGDQDSESDETFRLLLSNPSANASISDATAIATILDDDAPAPAVGLAQRPGNADCVAPPRPTGNASVTAEDPFLASPGFEAITKILQAPGDGSRWFVVEQAGRVRVFDAASPASPATYVDIAARVRSEGGEEGLLGMAFHPDFPATPEIFLSYTAGSTSSARQSRVVRLILDDPVSPQGFSEEILIVIDQFASNHNGGDIAFGPDGYLYLGLGDGGGAGDPQETGQDTTNLLGAMLRIDVADVPFPSPGYRIPPDNPFAGNARCGPTRNNADDCPEIFAWGLRNPWRWSFDPVTGELWAGDVGQDAREEVDLIVRGGNYGWDCREGRIGFEQHRLRCAAASSSRSAITRIRRATRPSPAATSIAARPFRRCWAATCSATTSRAASGRCRMISWAAIPTSSWSIRRG